MRKPILLHSVGHSGSTVVARMLNLLGWVLPEKDDDTMVPSGREAFHYHRRMEPEFSVRLNDQLVKHVTGGKPCDVQDVVDEMRRYYRDVVPTYGSPWIVKDPRFVLTLELIQDMILEEHPDALLLWNVKDYDLVQKSYQRRSEYVEWEGERLPGFYGRPISWLYANAQKRFDAWPGAKLRIDYADIKTLVRVMRDSNCNLACLEVFAQKGKATVMFTPVHWGNVEGAVVASAEDAANRDIDGIPASARCTLRELVERLGITRSQIEEAVGIFELDRDQHGHPRAGKSSW